MEDVTTNKRKMKELEDNLLYRLTSTQVSFFYVDKITLYNSLIRNHSLQISGC